MLEHERACVERRLGQRNYRLSHFNAVEVPAEPSCLDGIDAFIIGGSGDFSVHHPKSQSWVIPLRRVIGAALDRNVAGFGVCFGHQLLGVQLGSEVVTSSEHSELGTVTVDVTDEGRKDPLYRQFGESLRVHSGHSDYVVSVPSGVDLLASNARCQTQAFKVRGTQVYSVQFHPDMTGAEARYRYLAYRHGFADRLDDDAMRAAEKFIPEADESVSLLGSFLDQVGAR